MLQDLSLEKCAGGCLGFFHVLYVLCSKLSLEVVFRDDERNTEQICITCVSGTYKRDIHIKMGVVIIIISLANSLRFQTPASLKASSRRLGSLVELCWW